MPKNTIHKRTAPRPRKSASTRIERSQATCQRRTAATPTASVIADSVYKLRLAPKTGSQVLIGQEGEEFEGLLPEKLAADLWCSYRHFRFLVTGEKSSFDPLKAGMSPSTSLAMGLDGFRELLPRWMHYNIDKDHGTNEYHFTAYVECPGWGMFWHQLPVGHALQVLRKKRPALHDLFLSFIRVFSATTGASLWNDGMMGNAIEALDERIYQVEGEDPAAVESLREDIELYQNGLASKYAGYIRRAKKMSPADLLKRARRFSHPVANVIYEGCQLLLMDNRISHFDYFDAEYYMDSYYLDLDSQANIIWQVEDNLWNEHAQYLEAIGNEGIQEPILAVRIDKYLRSFDEKEIKKKSTWPKELSAYFSRSYETMTKLQINEPLN
jgi:hypothetical protein